MFLYKNKQQTLWRLRIAACIELSFLVSILTGILIVFLLWGSGGSYRFNIYMATPLLVSGVIWVVLFFKDFQKYILGRWIKRYQKLALVMNEQLRKQLYLDASDALKHAVASAMGKRIPSDMYSKRDRKILRLYRKSIAYDKQELFLIHLYQECF